MTVQSTIRGPQFGTSGVIDLRFQKETIERLEAIEKEIAKLEAGVTWEALPLAEAWANLGGGNQVMQIGTDKAGKVYIRGIVKTVKAYAFPATNLTIATIPLALRPKEVQYAGVAWTKDTEAHFAILPVIASSGGALNLTFGNSDAIGGTNGSALYLAIPQLVYTVN